MPDLPPPSAREKQLRLLNALDEAAAKLEASERQRTEPIAIIGAGCRFPGEARDIAAYWRLLALGIDATGEMPLDRWDIDALYDPNPDIPGKLCTRRGAFLPEIDRFDAEHFNISPREATTLDPQHRLLLEIAHEALDGAGQLDDRLAANLTGVFIGVTNNDYAHLLREHKVERPLDAYFITGNAPNGAAGRLSYQLGLRGPSMVVDTACSSSLTSVQLACQSLRQQECNLALAGGVNLLVMPDTYAALSRARLLAADGRCKTFDAAADGYGRGEGGGLIVLKRLSEAEQDGDIILATIRGGAINHDGPSSGFTVPNGAAQRTLLQQALAASRLTPNEVDYIEAHGTGTSLGDPIEVNALVDVYGENRPIENPLLLGSVKTNLGHLESGAGIAGLLKVVLSLWHRQLPRHLHFKTPSPRILWDEIPVKVTVDHQEWPDPGRPRRAGISSFGVSGTNAHLILEESPTTERTSLPVPRKRFRGNKRYWAFDRPQYNTAREWLYRIDWSPQPRREREQTSATFQVDAAARQVCTWAKHAAARYAGEAYARTLPALEQLAAAYAAKAIQELGDGTRVAPQHQRLWARLPQLTTSAQVDPSPAALVRELLVSQPDAVTEIKLLERCGENLPRVLTGEIDPLSLLFPAQTTPTAADLYGHNPVAQALNDLIGQWIAAATPTAEPLRILEIGGGTGATTAKVLAALGDRPVDYTFTDISALFLTSATSQFGDRAGFSARTLNIEQDPLKQGFAAGEFDLIIAANVFHATADLRQTLAHARTLLANGGQLALIELTAPLAFLDLVFGLTEGWWRFSDSDLRPSHPLIDRSTWITLLDSADFSSAAAHYLPESTGSIFSQQALLTATASGPSSEPAGLTGRWLFIGEPGASLTQGLAATAAEVTITPTHDLSPLQTTPTWDGVVYFPPTTLDPLDQTPLRIAVEIAHAIIESPAPWWIITQGAVATDSRDKVPELAAAGIWGFARTVAQEHPELKVRRIDWALKTGPALQLDHLLAELQRPDGEDQLAWRDGQRLAPRLVPAPTVEPEEPLSISADGTVLVVGGTGGLGLSLASWLGEKGARHIVLAARREADANSLPLLQALTVAGISVRIKQLDVSRPEEVSRVIAEISAEGPPLCGVVHSAGVLDDGALRQLDWSRFETVLAPKVAGAWYLHEQTRDLPLDFFVLFSSSTALLGTPGQANHAAANSWLDALAQHRRALGLPAVSINWGPWSTIGAAARLGVASQARRHGLDTISATKGWHLLGEVLSASPASIGVLPMTWSEAPTDLVRAPFFDRVRARGITATQMPVAPAAEPTQDWARLPPTKRVHQLRELIQREIAAVLGLEAEVRVDPAKGFFALGMDSLTAVEMRNRLQTQMGHTLPSTVVFDHPSTEALAQHLSAGFDPAKPIAETARPPLPAAPENVEKLSGAEISSLLDEELKGL